MYHIKQDQRAQRSAETIYNALVTLMNDQPYDTIKVSDIIRQADVGRSTFYRNFDEIDDILRMRCDQVFDEMVRYIAVYRQEQKTVDPWALLKPMLRYFYLHSSIIDQLLKADRIGIMQAAFRKRSQPLQAQFARQMQVDEVYAAYVAEVRFNVLIAIVTHWVKTGKRQAPDELADTLKAMLNNMITVDQLL